MRDVSVGDRIVCMNDTGVGGRLTAGRVYVVRSKHKLTDNIVVVGLVGVDGMFSTTRFAIEKVEPATGGGAGGMKYDDGKPRMALLFDGCPHALEAVAQVLTFGAQKYAAHSWQTVPEGEERYKSALLRHLTAVGKGEEIDSESNLHHLAHAACNALFILELELRKHK